MSYGEGRYAFSFEASASAPLTNIRAKEKGKDLLKEKNLYYIFADERRGCTYMSALKWRVYETGATHIHLRPHTEFV